MLRHRVKCYRSRRRRGLLRRRPRRRLRCRVKCYRPGRRRRGGPRRRLRRGPLLTFERYGRSVRGHVARFMRRPRRLGRLEVGRGEDPLSQSRGVGIEPGYGGATIPAAHCSAQKAPRMRRLRITLRSACDRSRVGFPSYFFVDRVVFCCAAIFRSRQVGNEPVLASHPSPTEGSRRSGDD